MDNCFVTLFFLIELEEAPFPCELASDHLLLFHRSYTQIGLASLETFEQNNV